MKKYKTITRNKKIHIFNLYKSFSLDVQVGVLKALCVILKNNVRFQPIINIEAYFKGLHIYLYLIATKNL